MFIFMDIKYIQMKYSMAQVETLTGIKAHTLRIWERRYSFLKPMRTKTNIRYYSDEQLCKLLNVSILVRNSYRISKIDKMTDEEINSLVGEILTTNNEDKTDEVNILILSMLELDEESFDKIFKRQLLTKGLFSAITELIYPFLRRVGILWRTKKLIPAQEHFISNLIRQKIIAAIEALPVPPTDAPSIILFLLEEEYHEIGLLLTSFIAKDLGWRVFYLGQNVPRENIAQVHEITDSDLMMTILIAPKSTKVNQSIKYILDTTSIPLLISGNPESIKIIEPNDRIVHVSSPKELIIYLNDTRNKLK